MSTASGPEGRAGGSVVVVGSANVDLVAFVERAPAAGETVVGGEFATFFGGKGANQAVMAGRLDVAVALVGCVGDDAHGRLTREALGAAGVDLAHLDEAAGVASGVAQIWVEADGGNRIVVIPGANALLRPERASAAVEHLRPDVVVGQLEVPQRAVTAAFAAARIAGATTVLNPAPAAPLAADLLAVTDWLVPNEGEFALLTGADGTDDDALLRAAERSGVRLVVTLGERGAALVAGDGSVRRMAAPTVAAVDTTGAGDAFVGAFAAALARGLDEERAVRVALACAADSVTRAGAQASYPDAERTRTLVAAALA